MSSWPLFRMYLVVGSLVLLSFALNLVATVPLNEATKCQEEEYTCRGRGSCIKRSQLCDRVADCPYGDDELDCNVHKPVRSADRECAAGFYKCIDHFMCVPFHQLCNRVQDCPSGDDEDAEECRDRIVVATTESSQSNYDDKKGQQDKGVNVNETKVLPSMDVKPIIYEHTGSGVFFINFGTIFAGNDNVNGHGNDYGNGNGNGVGNGNGNGNANGNNWPVHTTTANEATTQSNQPTSAITSGTDSATNSGTDSGTTRGTTRGTTGGTTGGTNSETNSRTNSGANSDLDEEVTEPEVVETTVNDSDNQQQGGLEQKADKQGANQDYKQYMSQGSGGGGDSKQGYQKYMSHDDGSSASNNKTAGGASSASKSAGSNSDYKKYIPSSGGDDQGNKTATGQTSNYASYMKQSSGGGKTGGGDYHQYMKGGGGGFDYKKYMGGGGGGNDATTDSSSTNNNAELMKQTGAGGPRNTPVPTTRPTDHRAKTLVHKPHHSHLDQKRAIRATTTVASRTSETPVNTATTPTANSIVGNMQPGELIENFKAFWNLAMRSDAVEVTELKPSNSSEAKSSFDDAFSRFLSKARKMNDKLFVFSLN